MREIQTQFLPSSSFSRLYYRIVIKNKEIRTCNTNKQNKQNKTNKQTDMKKGRDFKPLSIPRGTIPSPTTNFRGSPFLYVLINSIPSFFRPIKCAEPNEKERFNLIEHLIIEKKDYTQ
jgi:hypothetical protein